MTLRDCGEVLVEEVLEVVVVRVDVEPAPPEVRSPVPYSESSCSYAASERWRGATGLLKKAIECPS
jgi:hypothetical protein